MPMDLPEEYVEKMSNPHNPIPSPASGPNAEESRHVSIPLEDWRNAQTSASVWRTIAFILLGIACYLAGHGGWR